MSLLGLHLWGGKQPPTPEEMLIAGLVGMLVAFSLGAWLS